MLSINVILSFTPGTSWLLEHHWVWPGGSGDGGGETEGEAGEQRGISVGRAHALHAV